MTVKNRQQSVEILQAAVMGELTAVHQYLYFHFHLEDMGYKPLADIFHRIAIDEMRHVERLAEHILYLGGEVKMEVMKPVEYISGDVKKMLAYSDALESETITQYNDAIRICSAEGDNVTKRIFEDLLAQEEGHEDIFGTEGDNLAKFGDTFLALNAIATTKENAEGGE
jgi:bacterioferritin